MVMQFGLQLEQSQKLTITPQLRQAIQILQFTYLELEEYVEEQLEKNPVLEKTVMNDELSDTVSDREKIKEINWKEYVEDFNSLGYVGDSYYDRNNEFNYENIITKEITLREHLLFQYNLINMSDEKHAEIGEYIINSIDDRGYFMASVEEVASCFDEEQSTIENILRAVQTLDPPGVGARTLEECLLIQLNFLDIKDKKIYVLVEKYLSYIASNKYSYIARQLGVSIKKVQDYCDFIKTLEPKPGRNFTRGENRYIIPDVIVTKVGKEYMIISNDCNNFRLIIREDYKKIMVSSSENSDVSKFLSSRFNSAAWLIKSIEHRRETIYKVCEAIVKKQIDFFKNGKKHLKPMTLKEIADKIGMHESTVSRATSGKYMDTPFGMFELKYFFSSGTERGFGEEISSRSIKVFIRDIIDRENCKKPLSDEKIANELKNEGINISRRTVAKYRNELGIPSSSKRKKY